MPSRLAGLEAYLHMFRRALTLLYRGGRCGNIVLLLVLVLVIGFFRGRERFSRLGAHSHIVLDLRGNSASERNQPDRRGERCEPQTFPTPEAESAQNFVTYITKFCSDRFGRNRGGSWNSPLRMDRFYVPFCVVLIRNSAWMRPPASLRWNGICFFRGKGLMNIS